MIPPRLRLLTQGPRVAGVLAWMVWSGACGRVRYIGDPLRDASLDEASSREVGSADAGAADAGVIDTGLPDAGPDDDAGPRVELDVGFDVGSGLDTGMDAARSVDAGTDAPEDAAFDAPRDVGSDSPIDARVVPTIVSLVGTLNHVCATYSDGTGACRGVNDSAQLGTGVASPGIYTPATVLLPEGVPLAELAAGSDTTCGRYTDGGIRCWGSNRQGQLGIGFVSPFEGMPPRVELPGPAVSVAVGRSHACAALADGRVFCWGAGGTLGNGSGMSSTTPVAVLGLSDIVELAAGATGTCARHSPGGVSCWGQGALGDGVSTSSNTAVSVVGLGGRVVALAHRDSTCCALLADGSARCWGTNNSGQVGDGTTVDALAPVTPIGMGAGVVAIARGSIHTCALREGAFCWGANDFGQVGDGTMTLRTSPTPVVGLPPGRPRLLVLGYYTSIFLYEPTAYLTGVNFGGGSINSTPIVLGTAF